MIVVLAFVIETGDRTYGRRRRNSGGRSYRSRRGRRAGAVFRGELERRSTRILWERVFPFGRSRDGRISNRRRREELATNNKKDMDCNGGEEGIE